MLLKFFFFYLFISQMLLASITLKSFSSHHFFEDRVRFWEHLFSQLNENQYILIDKEKPWKVLKTGTCKKKCQLDDDFILSETQSFRLKNNHNLKILYGLKNDLNSAYEKSEQWALKIHKLLKKYNLPPELIAITFIESMFNFEAKSKVGAEGIWQLMPFTAKEFGLVVHQDFDERLDPLAATLVACKFFKKYSSQFESWPLTITSYNYGPQNLKNLIQNNPLYTFDELLIKAPEKDFGFAGRNFYAEYVAMNRILLQKPLISRHLEENSSSINVHLKQEVLLNHILNQYEIKDWGQFKKHNPAIKLKTPKKTALVPKNFIIRIPKSR